MDERGALTTAVVGEVCDAAGCRKAVSLSRGCTVLRDDVSPDAQYAFVWYRCPPDADSKLSFFRIATGLPGSVNVIVGAHWRRFSVTTQWTSASRLVFRWGAGSDVDNVTVFDPVAGEVLDVTADWLDVDPTGARIAAIHGLVACSETTTLEVFDTEGSHPIAVGSANECVDSKHLEGVDWGTNAALLFRDARGAHRRVVAR